jgi:hypothetical protein
MRTLRALLWLASDPKVNRRPAQSGSPSSGHTQQSSTFPMAHNNAQTHAHGHHSGGQQLYADMIYPMRNVPPFRSGSMGTHTHHEQSSGGSGNTPAATVMLWGSNTPTIVRECQKLSSALSLPALDVVFDHITLGTNKRGSSGNGDEDVVQQPHVLEVSFIGCTYILDEL